jgi:hypothetical protein
MRLACILLMGVCVAAAQPGKRLPQLKVSDNGRFLVTAEGKPFFYLADTGWELFHRLNREEAVAYLDRRAAQGFTVIQAVALAELDGLTDPNPYGALPLVDKDPARPAVTPGSGPRKAKEYDYWDHVDYIIGQANARGLYIALLPTWGRWVKNEPVLNVGNAAQYGEWLGKRYGTRGVIWVIGGDRTPTGNEKVWRELARGVAVGVSGKEDYDAVLMTFHPRGGEASSDVFHDDRWLDFNMWQNGHGIPGVRQPQRFIARDYARTPVKPVMDGEPLYEDHPLAFRAAEHGYSFDAHVRQYAYWDVFAGAFGHTYGNHSVWQMYAPGRKPVNGPLIYWRDAIARPGAEQMRHLRALIESRPFLSRAPDQSLLRDAPGGADAIVATRGDGYVFVYSGQGRKITLERLPFPGGRAKAYWYNPRNGAAETIGELDVSRPQDIACPSQGFGSDWVLVLDDAGRNFPAPGAGKP